MNLPEGYTFGDGSAWTKDSLGIGDTRSTNLNRRRIIPIVVAGTLLSGFMGGMIVKDNSCKDTGFSLPDVQVSTWECDLPGDMSLAFSSSKGTSGDLKVKARYVELVGEGNTLWGAGVGHMMGTYNEVPIDSTFIIPDTTQRGSCVGGAACRILNAPK